MICLLLKYDLEVNATDKEGYTPLHCASSLGFQNSVRILLSKGADVQAVDKRTKSTPLHLACCNGHIEAAKELLKGGSVVNALDQRVSQTLHEAAMFGDPELIKLLLEH